MTVGSGHVVDVVKGSEEGAAFEELLEVLHEGATERLDRVLARALPEMSRSRVQDLIKQGHARIPGKAALTSSDKVQPGTTITLTIPPAAPRLRIR
jgi:23S rRNA pseudouridine1911/1915/1917 synthase